MGLRFDTVISGYILILPLLLLSIASGFLKPGNNPFTKFYFSSILNIFIGVLYSVSFLICAIDIPFFNQFFARLNSMALAWLDTPEFVFKMIFQEVSYWIYMLPLILILLVFWLLLLRIRRKTFTTASISEENVLYLPKTIVLSLFIIGLLFVGIRGRLEQKSPIRIGTAFFSPYAFPNQLGLNPVFTFLRSVLDDRNQGNKSVQLMNQQKALNLSRYYLTPKAPPVNMIADTSPISRKIRFNDEARKMNVVVIIMESMGAAKLGYFGNKDNLTPFLDSLATVSLSFKNAYSAGIHTYNGIFSTLFGLPAIAKQNHMSRFPIQSYSGLSNTLKINGYHTLFAITHDDQFDNVGGFMHANSFDEVISQQNYPGSKVLSTLGVPDHFMFEFVMPGLNILHYRHEPFLAAFMTASDHGPYIVPKDIPFKPKHKDERKAATEYADWSLRHFFDMAKRQPWFQNTIFVLVADHGFAEGGIYDMPLTYHHVPLFFYAPGIIQGNTEIQGLAGQIDIFPTIMGFLRIEYENNTLGIDLMRQKRPYIYFSADDKIGCLNQEYFLVMRESGPPSFYNYILKDTYNYISANPRLVRDMKDYTYSMLQTTQYIIDNQMVGLNTAKPEN
jgi:phosphoglycerol transferase MdoB-like AlkP superfamily enzyme